jgi:hypothetical protein
VQKAIFMEQNMYEIWADFGRVGNIGKNWAVKYAAFEDGFFMLSVLSIG